MYEYEGAFRRGAIRPMQCFREGWQLIKRDYWLFLGICLVGSLLAGLAPLGILAGPMMCGIHLCLLGRMRGREPSMSLLFKGFDHFLQSFIATLFMIVPMIVVILPAYIVLVIVMMGTMPAQPKRGMPPAGPPDMTKFFITFGVFYLLILIVTMIIGVLFFFVYPLIVDRRLTGIEAVKLSLKAVFANLGGVVGVMLLNMVFGLLGFMCCYFGIIFVLPLNFAVIATAYRQVFPDEAELDDYGDEPMPDRPRSRSPATDIQAPSGRERIQ